MEPAADRRRRRLLERGASALAYAAVAALGLWVIAPASLGVMPLTADHLVHVTRASLVDAALGRGHLSGWSPHWYFGFPLGELYPPVGDLAVAALRRLSLGALDLRASYALVFAAAFVGQGLVLVRAARLLGAGRLAAAIAGALLLVDPGALREGGWRYTVEYGVWLQPLATALVWWAFAQLAAVMGRGAAAGLAARRLSGPGLTFAAALLTHPIATPMVALGLPIFALTLGLGGRLGVGRALVGAGAAAGLGVSLAAWWLLPLAAHRHWMSSYGVIHGTFAAIGARLAEGSWAANMAPALGPWIALGLVRALAPGGGRGPRFVALFALALYLLHVGELFWLLRLDWFWEGFLSIQFQRFVISAKPGLFVAAGLGLTLPLALRRAPWAASGWRRRVAAAAAAALTGAAVIGAGAGVAAAMGEHEVGALEVERRRPVTPSFDADLATFAAWAGERWRERGDFFRLAYQAGRHDHSFMDVAVDSGAPAYKLGFTPGENFVHKPEGGAPALLDRLRVRYVAGTGPPPDGVVHEAARFGGIRVWERPGRGAVAEVSGPGEVEVLEEDYDAGVVRVRVRGADEGARLTFNIAGYPRWQLLHGDEAVEWVEAPAIGDAPPATQAERRARRLREGDPGPPDGREPMLIAVEGRGDGVYTLRYRRWLPVDALGLAALAVGLAVLGLARSRWAAGLDRALDGASRWLGPRALGGAAALAAALVASRGVQGYRREAGSAVGWFYTRAVGEGSHAAVEVMKVARLLRPAVVLRAHESGAAWVVFPGVQVTTDASGRRLPITGWYASSDEAVASGEAGHRARLELGVRAAGQDGPWQHAGSIRPARGHGRQPLAIATDAVAAGPVDVLVVLRAGSGSPLGFGFDLELGAPAGDEPAARF